VFLETLTFAAFACLLVYLTASGEYLRYLAPRMAPYLYFAAAVMLVWAVFGALRIRGAGARPRCAHCFVLAVPLLLALLPHRAMNASDAAFGAFSASRGAAALSPADTSPAPPDTPADAPPPEAAPPAKLDGLDVTNRRITVGETDYYRWIQELYDNLDTYEGYTLSVTGFVFKDPDFMDGDEFVPARLMISCCVADLVLCGIPCRYDGADTLTNDEWVTVEGVIERGEYMGYEEARLSVTSLTPAEPIEGFVYSY
jgi:putative membrane protein